MSYERASNLITLRRPRLDPAGPKCSHVAGSVYMSAYVPTNFMLADSLTKILRMPLIIRHGVKTGGK